MTITKSWNSLQTKSSRFFSKFSLLPRKKAEATTIWDILQMLAVRKGLAGNLGLGGRSGPLAGDIPPFGGRWQRWCGVIALWAKSSNGLPNLAGKSQRRALAEILVDRCRLLTPPTIDYASDLSQWICTVCDVLSFLRATVSTSSR